MSRIRGTQRIQEVGIFGVGPICVGDLGGKARSSWVSLAGGLRIGCHHGEPVRIDGGLFV